MKKVRLDLNELAVDSFEPAPRHADPRGTVHGHYHLDGPSGGWGDCTHYGTCQGTCVQTCGGPTCEAPCDFRPYPTWGEACSWTNGVVTCRT